MRIVVLGSLGPDLFADNVRDSLVRMGHEVHALGESRPPLFKARQLKRIDGLLGLVSDHEDRVDMFRQNALAKAIQRLHPDLVLTIDWHVHRRLIEAAQSVGAKVALWFPDHVSSMGRHDMFINGYDRVYLTNPVLVDRLNSIYKLPVAYLPEACNSSWHRPRVEYGTEQVVVMVGNVHPTRAALLDNLVRDGIPLRIYGAGVPDWVGFPALTEVDTGEYIARERKADVFRSARVVLNNLHPAEYAGMNCRLFEATGCGGLVLTEAREGLAECFTVGREVDIFETYDELVAKIRGCLADPKVGLAMADAAALRSHEAHTYESRLLMVFEDLGLE